MATDQKLKPCPACKTTDHLSVEIYDHGWQHPTVKPVDLMAYLCRLITPPGGTILDPFAGSGTTGMACLRESFNAILIEREAEYVADIHRRIAHVHGEDTPLFARLEENEASLFEGIDLV